MLQVKQNLRPIDDLKAEPDGRTDRIPLQEATLLPGHRMRVIPLIIPRGIPSCMYILMPHAYAWAVASWSWT